MKKNTLLLLILVSTIGYVHAQDTIRLNLDRTIRLATTKSLTSFRAKNMYMASYWEYRSFKAARLPSLTLNMTPIRYNRDITKRYDSQQDIDVYRKQQSLYTYGGLAIQQNLDLTGGTFFIDSELGYLRNFGDNKYTQYNSIPFRIGYRQNLLGYNPFKWERRIEPIKFERAKKKLIVDLEQTAELASTYFFDLAMAQAEYELAVENVKNTNKLYRIGQEKHKIASIGRSDLLTLKLDYINAQNSLKNTEIRLNRAMFALATFLNFDKSSKIKLDLPTHPQDVDITVEQALTYAQENNPEYLKSKQTIIEAQQIVDQRKKESFFDASINASVGFNQVAETFNKAYKSPLQQDIVELSLSIPLVDWGVRKGKYNMAKNNLKIAELTAQQDQLSLEEDVIMTVGDFVVQQQMIQSGKEAMDLANLAYEQTQERFIIGKADINSITLSTNRRQEAQRNYIASLKNYWLSYFKIRRLTLYNFESKTPIDIDFNQLELIK